jgi:hypothetical protein
MASAEFCKKLKEEEGICLVQGATALAKVMRVTLKDIYGSCWKTQLYCGSPTILERFIQKQ